MCVYPAEGLFHLLIWVLVYTQACSSLPRTGSQQPVGVAPPPWKPWAVSSKRFHFSSPTAFSTFYKLLSEPKDSRQLSPAVLLKKKSQNFFFPHLEGGWEVNYKGLTIYNIKRLLSGSTNTTNMKTSILQTRKLRPRERESRQTSQQSHSQLKSCH